MKLGISTASFFNRIPTEGTFDVLRQMRIDTTEVFLNTFCEYEKSFVDTLASKRGTIAVHSVHPQGTQFEPQLFNSNSRIRADAESIFRKVCYAAFALGAKYYTFHGPICLKRNTYIFDYIKLGERINQLIEIANSYHVKLSYENVQWAYGATPEYFKHLLIQCPNLYTTLDTKQAMLAGIDPIKFLDVMEGRLSSIHLCDVTKAGDTALPGEGKINFLKFLTELDNRRMNVNMFIEAYPNDYKDLNHLKQSYDYMAAMMIRVRS